MCALQETERSAKQTRKNAKHQISNDKIQWVAAKLTALKEKHI